MNALRSGQQKEIEKKKKSFMTVCNSMPWNLLNWYTSYKKKKNKEKRNIVIVTKRRTSYLNCAQNCTEYSLLNFSLSGYMCYLLTQLNRKASKKFDNKSTKNESLQQKYKTFRKPSSV